VVSVLIEICNLLGVDYNENYLNSLNDDCKKIEYLLNCIYKFLGGR